MVAVQVQVELAIEVDAVGAAHLDSGRIARLVYRRARQERHCVLRRAVLCEFFMQSYHGRVGLSAKMEMH